MKVDKVVRVVLALVIVAAVLALLAAALFVTESALNVWSRLGDGPAWLRYAFVGALVSLALATLYLVLRFVIPRRGDRPARREPLTEAALSERIAEADGQGAQTGGARAELDELARRRAANTVHICVFGEVSAGKSTLIESLLPGADVRTSPVGGSTIDIRHYRWRSEAGDGVLLTDVPGTGSAGENLDAVARQEAMRAHVVLYLCDGDLNRQQLAALEELTELDKPTIVVLNKVDRYRDEELAQLRARIGERLAGLGRAGQRAAVVAVSAGGEETVTVIDAAGNERRQTRTRAPELANLKLAVQEMLARDPDALTTRRDQAVFRLAMEKLETAQNAYRQERAEALIRGYTKKAVIGALAAISPGTDIVIQGYLGTTMTRDLCALWGVSVRDMDVEEFLNLSQSRVGKALPLTLAVAGNGLKAFPGLGTVAGGLVHAVAYGLIFDALGRSLAQSLAERGRFEPDAAAAHFEDSIGEHLEKGVRRVARLALEDRHPQR